MSGELNRLDFTTDVKFFDPFAEVSYRGVCGVIRPENVDRFSDLIKSVDVLNGEDGQRLVVAWVEEGEAVTRLQF